MIAPKMDLLESLGALVGPSAPAPSGDGGDFAGMLAAAKIAPETDVVAPTPDGGVPTTLPAIDVMVPEPKTPATPAMAREPVVVGMENPQQQENILATVADQDPAELPVAPSAIAAAPVEPVSAPENTEQPDMVANDPAKEIVQPKVVLKVGPKPDGPETESKGEDGVVQAGCLPKPNLRQPVMGDAPEVYLAERPDDQDLAVNDGSVPAVAEVSVPVALAAAPAANPVALLVVASDAPTDGPTPQPAKPRAIERRVEQAAPPANDVRIAVAAPVLVEPAKAVAKPVSETPEPTVAALPDQRPLPTIAAPVPDKPALALPDRLPIFAPLIADAVRDLASIARDKDLRFNVRPETLGPVAVTIERGEAGLGLRLGVDTPAAAQAVRQAEPMLNDARGTAPFVQVSVDLNSPDARGRPVRAAAFVKRARQDGPEIAIQQKPVTTGRYA